MIRLEIRRSSPPPQRRHFGRSGTGVRHRDLHGWRSRNPAFCETSVNEGAATANTAWDLPLSGMAVDMVSIGDASIFLMSDKPKPATAAMPHPTRMTVPHNAAAMIANRRGPITVVSYCPLEPGCWEFYYRADVSIKKMIARWREPKLIAISDLCCLNTTYSCAGVGDGPAKVPTAGLRCSLCDTGKIRTPVTYS